MKLKSMAWRFVGQRRFRIAIALLLISVASVLAFGLQSPWLMGEVSAWTSEEDYINADLIRVGISDNEMNTWEYPLTRITATGAFTVKDKVTGLQLFQGKTDEVVNITVDRNGFHLKSAIVSPAQALLVPQSAPTPLPLLHHMPVTSVPTGITLTSNPLIIAPVSASTRLKIANITRRKEIPQFRGVLEIHRAASAFNKLSVINVVSLEDYLKAVVPNELPMRYGLEAVKAQSVAARNYAVRPREKPWKTFDICDSQLCQVYLGAQTETPDSNRAIADTEGLVGLYNSDPILALFSSSHGGYAENYSNAFSDPVTKQFPAPPIDYLKGGPDISLPPGINLKTEAGARQFWTSPAFKSFDVDSPYYRWTKQWTGSELEAAISQGLQEVSKDRSTRDFVSPWLLDKTPIGAVKKIQVLERGSSGKIMSLAIQSSKGNWIVKKEFLVRKLFKKDGKMLPSGNVVFTPHYTRGQVSSLTAQGGGFGHGVGLSQLGASWMHKHGYLFPQIIQHYYRGASLGSLPIEVGQVAPEQTKAMINRPVLTRFKVNQPHGTLWIQEGILVEFLEKHQEPVTIKLNGKLLKLAPVGFRSGVELQDQLKANEINTLVLFPDEKNPERRLKAWIELYPAKT